MKSPAFSFYVRDWLCSKTVSKLHSKPCSKGVSTYLYLLCSSWLEDPRATLPTEENELAGLGRVSVDEFREIWPFIKDQFPLDTSIDRLFNERLRIESEKQYTRSKSGSKGGSKKVANLVAALEDANANEIPELKECIARTMTVGIPEKFTKHVYEDWSTRSGKDAGGVVVAFLPYVTKRWMREQVEWRNGNHKGTKTEKKKKAWVD